MEQTEKDSNVVVKDMLQILHLPKVETFVCGSMAYFNGMEDYNEDEATLEIVEYSDTELGQTFSKLNNGRIREVVNIPRVSNTQLLNIALKDNGNYWLKVFLAPAFLLDNQITINFLSKLKPLAGKLDKEHKYLEFILNSYLHNNSFILSANQRYLAFKIYDSAKPKFNALLFHNDLKTGVHLESLPQPDCIVGSNAFFESMQGYKPKDKDCIVFTNRVPQCHVIATTANGGIMDYYFMPKFESKDKFLKYIRNGNTLLLGAIIVPKVIKRFGIGISDIVELKPMFANVDKEHSYQQMIVDFYIKNNSFALTDAQRLQAYNEYKRQRPARYGKGKLD